MDFVIPTLSIIVAVIALGYSIKRDIKNDQNHYRGKVDSRISEVEKELDMLKLVAKNLERTQTKFETRIESHLAGLQESIDKLQTLIIERVLT